MRNATTIATAIACSSHSVPATAKKARLANSTNRDRHPPQPRQLNPPSGPRSFMAAPILDLSPGDWATERWTYVRSEAADRGARARGGPNRFQTERRRTDPRVPYSPVAAPTVQPPRVERTTGHEWATDRRFEVQSRGIPAAWQSSTSTGAKKRRSPAQWQAGLLWQRGRSGSHSSAGKGES